MSTSHPLAGQTATLALITENHQGIDGAEIVIEDRFSNIGGGDVAQAAASGNFAAMNFVNRMMAAGENPLEGEALYGKVGGLGYVVSEREIVA